MAECTVTLECRMTWWLHVYVAALIVFCRLTRHEPNQDRLSRIVKSGLRCYIDGHRVR